MTYLASAEIGGLKFSIEMGKVAKQADGAAYVSYGDTGVRVGLENGNFVINPPLSRLKDSDLNLAIAGSEEAIVMVEASANQVSEELMVEALEFGHDVIRKLIALQKELYAQVRPVKREVV